jgi:glycopeptide antibiotics resistance protein
MTTGPKPRAALRPSAYVALAFAVFIVYGALFPFNFVSNPMPVETVFADWNPFRNRSDAVDNIVLFLPLGAALWFACQSSASRWALAVASWLLLSVGLQLAQLYLPSRVASMTDAINNAFGLLIGMQVSRTLAPWLRRQQLVSGSFDPLAMLLVAFWYGYESFPFLPTLDVGLLAAHIKPVLSGPAFEPLRLLRHALAAALGTLILLEARPLRSRRVCVLAALAVLLGSELLVPYGDLRIETMLGIVLGTAVGERLNHAAKAYSRWAVLTLAAVALTMTVVTEFRGPPGAARFTLTPFSHVLWHGTTVGVPTAAFQALAIGGLLWAGVTGRTPLGARSWHWPAMVAVLVGLLECLRIVLASGPADTSMLVTSLLLAPFAAALHRKSIKTARPDELHGETGIETERRTDIEPLVRATDSATAEIRAPKLRTVVWQAVGVLMVLTLGLRLLLEVSGVPYNVLELFAARSVLNIGLFSVALLWLGAGPWCLAKWAGNQPRAWLWLPTVLPLAALLSLLLLRISVTQESLNDITGSTDLYRRVTMENYWGEAWRDAMVRLPATMVDAMERGVRFTALYSLLLAPLTMASICTDRTWLMRRRLPALALLMLLWWLAAWLVIDGAITDNLTELIARDGSVWLAALAALFSLHVSWASGRMSTRRGVTMGVVTLVALPLSWWLSKQGLEQTILKYDSVWSAQQFLLGRNRIDRLSEGQLFMRWSGVYIAMLGVCALGMTLARRLWTASTATTSSAAAIPQSPAG